MIPFPDKKYQIIYADPPWEYKQSGGVNGSRGMAKTHYATMPTEDICNLPVDKIAGGGGYLLPLGNIPKYQRSCQGHGGVGLPVQDRRFRVDQNLPEKRKAVLGNGGLYPSKRRSLPAGDLEGI